MSQTNKPFSDRDADQTLRASFNDVDKSITTAGFLVGSVGHKVTRTNTSGGDLGPAAAGDDFAFSDNGTPLYTLRILYNDVDKTNFLSAERVV